MATTDYVVLPDDLTFVSPEVPEVTRTYRKAKDVLKALIVNANSEAANIDFQDLEVTLVPDERKFTLSLKEAHVNRYILTTPVEFTYNEIDFAQLVTGASYLNFASQYDESKLEEVYVALGGKDNNPHYEFSYAEETQELTVTVKAQNTKITFMDDDATPVTALFPGKKVVITFKDDATDLAPKFTETELNIELTDLLEAVAAAA